MSKHNRLNQRDVNKIHRLHRDGCTRTEIGKRFGITCSTVTYVLRNRAAVSGECDRCGEVVGPNRARSVRRAKFSGSWRFCPPCHGWVFAPENHHAADRLFTGIF